MVTVKEVIEEKRRKEGRLCSDLGGGSETSFSEAEGREASLISHLPSCERRNSIKPLKAYSMKYIKETGNVLAIVESVSGAGVINQILKTTGEPAKKTSEGVKKKAHRAVCVAALKRSAATAKRKRNSREEVK
jgi:hypothetical protein